MEVPALARAEASAPEETPAPAEASVPALVPAEVSAPEETPAPASVEASAPAEALAQAEAPAQYPSEHLIQSASEENQIPSHLPACPSLRHIASLRGSAIVEFFHSSIAEVVARCWCEEIIGPGGCGRACIGVSLGFSDLPVLAFSRSFSHSQLGGSG